MKFFHLKLLEGNTTSKMWYSLKKYCWKWNGMLKTPCLHTEILNVLSKCGHGDKVLIADGNYPIESNTNENVKIVYLNLTHGIPLVTEVLEVLNDIIEIEKIEVMVPGNSSRPPIFDEFMKIVESIDQLDELGRFDFYEACKKENIKLAIATGEQRIFANVLLTIGAVQPKKELL